jgi:fatty-acyl-CoA synthase
VRSWPVATTSCSATSRTKRRRSSCPLSGADDTSGWFRTGDLAVVHPDGYLEIRDRSKDIIISGGENISSVEIERALDAHPAVLESAVVGIPHEK